MSNVTKKALQILLEICKEKAQEDIYFVVRDSESTIVKSADPYKVADEMIGYDDELGINIHSKESKKYLGWLGILTCEAIDEMVYDHSDNELCDEIFKEYVNKTTIFYNMRGGLDIIHNKKLVCEENLSPIIFDTHQIREKINNDEIKQENILTLTHESDEYGTVIYQGFYVVNRIGYYLIK